MDDHEIFSMGDLQRTGGPCPLALFPKQIPQSSRHLKISERGIGGGGPSLVGLSRTVITQWFSRAAQELVQVMGTQVEKAQLPRSATGNGMAALADGRSINRPDDRQLFS